MEASIKLETLEIDIAECSKHLKFLRGSTLINKDIIDIIRVSNFNELVIKDITIGQELSNIHCIATLSELELSIILKSLHHSNDLIETKQIIKNAILLIYESIKTLDKFGKTLQEFSCNYPSLKSEFDYYTKGMKSFKKNIKIDSNYKNIRNFTAGHILSDYEEYAKVIDTIDPDEQIYNLYQFRLIINTLNKYLYNCFSKTL